eukprot:CAMPEP_0174261992 /NCGR_PEP_ID=MMETSP0439-20130205/12709_1 /TAXON_ID=0 /ORGANISM="Stereomyxa ramosa, Strain Chinc5" /LENGTH=495 /DNA_ID=CAMNT_0015346619 /DNA_START=63 /DNA_END=1547 /DNA_ORIENTATION=+
MRVKLEILLGVWFFGCVFCSPPDGTKFNFIQITDIHGWINGHPHEPQLNADLGDFASLIEHMIDLKRQQGEEFFLFDSGDLIEGTGLSDATEIHGYYIFEAVKRVQFYNALTIGNHDIGKNNVVQDMEKNFVPFWNHTYLTANSKIASTGDYIGDPYCVIETDMGTKLLVLGYLFDFTQNAPMTKVTPVSISLTEEYFKQAMSIPDIDIIVVVAHIDPQTPPELQQIYNATRAYHPDTPLIMFSGHRHVKYYEQYDANALTMESGKYFEVIGQLQFTLSKGNMVNISHEFISTELDNFYDLAQKNASNFLTPSGKELKEFINATYKKLGLGEILGCSNITYSPYSYFSDPDSLYHLYVQYIVPLEAYNKDFAPKNSTPFFIVNAATLRYDLYQGKVVSNDIYTIIPFGDVFYYFLMSGNVLLKLVSTVDSSDYQSKRDRVPYFKTDEQAKLGSGADFYYSDQRIDPNQNYILVLAEYDTIEIGEVLNEIDPSQKW